VITISTRLKIFHSNPGWGKVTLVFIGTQNRIKVTYKAPRDMVVLVNGLKRRPKMSSLQITSRSIYCSNATYDIVESEDTDTCI